MTKLHALAALCLAGASSLFVGSVASANGRFPAASQFVPVVDNQLVLRATFGLLLSGDKGASWSWVCEEAVGFTGNQDPAIAVTAAGTILAGLAEGLSISADGGCGWAFAAQGLEKQLVIDVAVRKAAPSTAYALTSTLKTGDGGAPAFNTQLFRSADDGKTWTAVGPAFDPTFRGETVEVAESDPNRLYVSGVRGGGSTALGVLFVSVDGGGTWQERAVALELPNEKAPYLAAVDPADANRLYVRTAGVSGGRILVSTDGGVSFVVSYKSKGPLLGFALSADGATVFAGGPQDGLLAATREGLQFEPRSATEVQCLATQGDVLWVCSNDATSFLLGASSDGGRTFQPRLRLAQIRGVLACPAPEQPMQCAARWPALREQVGAGVPPATGQPDAGVAADAAVPTVDAGAAQPTSASSSDGGGCSIHRGGNPTAYAALAAFGFGVLLVVAAKRARRKN
jgi:hypothetical protein